MASLDLRGVVKRFGAVEVIHGLDLHIDDGEFVVFVGPSGCGKSTLLRMIAGLEEVSAGEIRLDGEPVNEVPAAKRGLAMVFQSYALYPHMSVRKNLSFGLETLRTPKAGDQASRRGRGRDPADRRVARPPARTTVRRPAPARRDRPRHRARAEDLPLRRAAVQPRRGAARADAGRDQEAAPAAWRDNDLRHPRPGRGDDACRPDRGPARPA